MGTFSLLALSFRMETVGSGVEPPPFPPDEARGIQRQFESVAAYLTMGARVEDISLFVAEK